MKPIRVVVADDQELVRAGFGMILDAQPDIEVVAEACDGAEAIEAVRAHGPDVLLLDVRMPVMDGLEAARRVCAEFPSTKVIMLTTFDVDDYVFDALYAGASGFLLKDVRRDDLAHGVRMVASGEALLAPSVTRRLISEFAARRPGAPERAVRPPSKLLEQLTLRERETLRLLARGLSNAEIAAELVVSEHTVKTHVSNVLSKLGLRDRVHAVVFAYEAGAVVAGEA
ncbi:DNA-binding NarL/FixJ family response regulator [Kitasatospora sp. MAA19]|uniref:response regulator transcription factor n=1 Tax=Kitasatospora sp. MAA19 TaxID=3035090 RepID=UPI0024771DB1|nr:response regulator transcription factor [Kitasatospora sp. MAA19]MDH6704606.1 DNA-binding NarL/FixJ family response regulator [Kitasatospora sp. MAA19]